MFPPWIVVLRRCSWILSFLKVAHGHLHSGWWLIFGTYDLRTSGHGDCRAFSRFFVRFLVPARTLGSIPRS